MSTLRFPGLALALVALALGADPAHADQHEAGQPASAPGAAAPAAERPSCLGKARLRGELFAEDSAELKPEVLPTLDLVAEAMNGRCAGKRILIEGHTEHSGAGAADQAISEKRAIEVKAQLVARGVAADRLDTRGFGATRPLTNDAALEALNRRVTFVVEGE